MNSRSVSGDFPLTFDDGTTMSETEAFDAFIFSLAEDPDNRIYLFDSVVRLASTVGYQGFGWRSTTPCGPMAWWPVPPWRGTS